MFRSDFELSMLFGIPGVPTFAGCLQTLPDGTYMHMSIEMAYRGYVAGREGRGAPRDAMPLRKDVFGDVPL